MTIDKLPTHPFILCTTPGCDSKTTCFGKNLESKIKQAGGVAQLLNTFKCRHCRPSKQPIGSTKIKTKKIKRISKTQVRAEKVQEMLSALPKMDFSSKSQVGFLRDLPETVRSITKNGSCIRPDIFLDSNKVCDDCVYKDPCESVVKTFSKHYKPSNI